MLLICESFNRVSLRRAYRGIQRPYRGRNESEENGFPHPSGADANLQRRRKMPQQRSGAERDHDSQHSSQHRKNGSLSFNQLDDAKPR